MVSDHPDCAGGSRPQSRLLVHVTLRLHDGLKVGASALIDTGAEASLIRRGLVPEEYYQWSADPKRFVAANQLVMDGGAKEVPCEILLDGVDPDTGLSVTVQRPAKFYDAIIGVDLILSYEWLKRHNIDVLCHRHGLQVNRPEGPVWVPGGTNHTRAGMTRGVNAITERATETTPGHQPLEHYTVRWPFLEEILERFQMEPT